MRAKGGRETPTSDRNNPNPGMGPGQKENQPPFALQDDAQPTEPTGQVSPEWFYVRCDEEWKFVERYNRTEGMR